MALSDRATALAPYAQQLLYNPDVQARAREASQALRGREEQSGQGAAAT